jgi:large subunit ribosomal protein L35
MKQKTHRGAAKRFRVTRTGKVLHRRATGNHFLRKRTSSSKRRVEGMSTVAPGEARVIKRILGLR